MIPGGTSKGDAMRTSIAAALTARLRDERERRRRFETEEDEERIVREIEEALDAELAQWEAAQVAGLEHATTCELDVFHPGDCRQPKIGGDDADE